MADTNLKGFSGRGESGIPKGRPATDSMRIDSPGGGPCAERIPVCTENLDSDVLMMQSADHGVRRDASDLLNRAGDRRIVVQ
jgi:hypothetical protein